MPEINLGSEVVYKYDVNGVGTVTDIDENEETAYVEWDDDIDNDWYPIADLRLAD